LSLPQCKSYCVSKSICGNQILGPTADVWYPVPTKKSGKMSITLDPPHGKKQCLIMLTASGGYNRDTTGTSKWDHRNYIAPALHLNLRVVKKSGNSTTKTGTAFSICSFKNLGLIILPFLQS